MREPILVGIAKNHFENWAKIRVPFSYNKHTKRLIIHGKYFEEINRPMQLSAIIEFLDSKGIWIIVNPMDNPNWWSFQILMEDIMSPFFQAYEHLLDDQTLTSRFLATEKAVLKAIELYNDNQNY